MVTLDDAEIAARSYWNPRWLAGYLMLGCLVVGGAVTLLSEGTRQLPGPEPVLSGQWAATYEDAYDRGLMIRDAGITAWAAIEYAIFGTGRPGVVVGDDDWLFTAEEFAGGDAMARNLDLVERVAQLLEARDIGLVVALVPDKARVYGEQLGRHAYPGQAQPRYQAAQATLAAAGIAVPDLLQPLLAAKGQAPVFLRTDTHWTPFGAAVAAEALAGALDEPVGDAAFATRVVGRQAHEGDLMKFIPLGPAQAWLGPEPDSLELRETVAAEAAAGDLAGALFDAAAVPVVLVGTSYSANELWNFDGALRQALGAEVLNVAAQGQGPLPPMLAYLADPAFTESPPALVVWEIPERYLPVDPGLEPEQLAILDQLRLAAAR